MQQNETKRVQRFAGLSGSMKHYGMEAVMVLKVLPSLGPSKRTTAITTMATNESTIAYSTRPCPLSSGVNNMTKFLSKKNT